MTNIGPYSEPQNFTHMFDIPDIRGTKYKIYNSDSLMGILYTIPEFSKFIYLVKRANLDTLLDDIEQCFSYTLFIPTDDKYNIDINIDICDARELVLSCMLNNKITYELLYGYTSGIYPTRFNPNKLLITRNDNKLHVGETYITHPNAIVCKNGIIHVVDEFIVFRM